MNNVPEILPPPADVAVDRQKLRVVKSILEDAELIASTTIEPTTHQPRLLRATVDAEFGPPSRSFDLVSEWYLNEDFVIRFLETSNDPEEIYRWDNHQEDNSLETGFRVPGNIRRDHSFPGLPTHPIWICMRILPEIEQYLSTL